MYISIDFPAIITSILDLDVIALAVAAFGIAADPGAAHGCSFDSSGGAFRRGAGWSIKVVFASTPLTHMYLKGLPLLFLLLYGC